MANQYAQVIELVKQTENIAQSYQLKTSISEIQQEASKTVLHIMLYGAYNAGKSTLINVLSGKEVAPVEDIPKTDKIDHYQWNDYVLLDTPGVNAPIEHENVTSAQLERCSVILFVIRDGDMDSQDVYKRLFELLKADKKIFIVFNHQLQNEEQKKEATTYIHNKLLDLAKKYDVDMPKLSEVEIVAMNLRTALKGREINQEKLLDHSGYTHFMERFDAWTMQQNSERQKFNGFKTFVNDCWYTPLLEQLDGLKSKSEQEKEKSKALLEEKNDLSVQKTLIFQRLSDTIRQQVASNKPLMLDVWQNSSGGPQIKSEMKHIFQKMSLATEQAVNSELSSFSFNFDTQYSLPAVTESPATENDNVKQIEGLIKDVLDPKKLVISTIPFPSDIKLPNTILEKVLGGFMGKALPLLQVALSVWDMFSSQKAEAERNAQQQNAMLQVHQTIERICTDFVNDAYQAVEQAVYPIFDQKIAEVQQQLEALKSENSALDEAFNKVIESQTRMLAIQW